MKLSELVRLQRTLEAVYPADYEYPLQTALRNLVDSFEVRGKVSKACVEDIKTASENINNEFASIRHHLYDYKAYIQTCINQVEDEYYNRSEQIYLDSLQDDAKYILNRRKESLTFADDENKKFFLSRLAMYHNWKYPALEIRPAHGEVTDFLKGCDPLYLLDTDENLFSEVKKKWNNVYQRRLRYYTFQENRNQPMHELPDNQFGLICSVDYYNFKPIAIIKKHLTEFYKKLRPGGVAIFTYNNCDLPYAVRNVENNFCCYTPENQVIKFATEAGFEIIKSINRLENISWLEIRKPGEITSIRGGQTLGEIRHNSTT